MDAPSLLQLAIMATMGVICAVIAQSRGRSALAWSFSGFFFTCIGLVLLLVLPDLRVLEKEKERLLAENRRLREEVRLNREVSDRRHEAVSSRLRAHDRALGVDTGESAQLPLTNELVEPPRVRTPDHESKQWYFVDESGTQGRVTFGVLRTLWKSGALPAQNSIRSADMTEWSTIEHVPGLREALDGTPP